MLPCLSHTQIFSKSHRSSRQEFPKKFTVNFHNNYHNALLSLISSITCNKVLFLLLTKVSKSLTTPRTPLHPAGARTHLTFLASSWPPGIFSQISRTKMATRGHGNVARGRNITSTSRQQGRLGFYQIIPSCSVGGGYIIFVFYHYVQDCRAWVH